MSAINHRTADLAQIDYLRTIAQALTTAEHGTKGQLVQDTAKFLGISVQETYRRLEAVGYTTKRKTRSDKGKSCIDAATAQLVGGVVYHDTRENGKRTTPINRALKQLQANGLAPKVSAATIARQMRRHHCHPTQLETPSAHVTQCSAHPNHVWQVDASVCIKFYMPEKGGIADMHIKEFNKNKPDNFKKIERFRVIRYVITDHFSGSLYVEYVKGSEDAKNLIQVLLNAMQRRGTTNPMHGVPHIIYTDKGSAMTSGVFKNLVERLQIKIIDHIAGNPRAKGQVENAQNIVERQFEGRLKRMHDQIQTIEDLNRFAWQWMSVFNHTEIHSRHNRTRNQVWQTIKQNELRIAPPLEICQELVTSNPKPYQVNGDLTVTHTIKGYGNLSYSLRNIPDIYPKCQVHLIVNPYRIPDIDVLVSNVNGDTTTYTVSPQNVNVGGFAETGAMIGEQMKSMPDSPIDIARKTILQQAYSVTTDEAVSAAIKAKVAPYANFDSFKDISDITVPDYLPRAGNVIDTIASKRELAPLSIFEAAKQIRGLVGDIWTPEHYQALLTSYPNKLVPADAIEAIAEAITDNSKPQANALRVVGL